MNMKLHELRQKHKTIATDMHALNDKHSGKKWGEDEQRQWDEMSFSIKQVEADIDRLEQLDANDQRYLDDNHDDVKEQMQEQRNETSVEKRHAAAFDAFVRHGSQALSAEQRNTLQEMRAQSVGTDTAGGHTVPTEFRNRIIETMKSYGGIASVCQILNTSKGDPIEYPVSDGTSEMGVLLGENQQAGEQDVTFGMVTLGAKKLSSNIIRVSNELLNDSAISMEAFLGNRIAMRLGRAEAYYVVNGTGAGTPAQNKGLKASTTLSQAASAAAAISHDDLINLKHKVDPAYRNGPAVRYAFNDTTFKLLKLLKDTQGRPLWLPSIAGVAPSTIDGEQFVVDQGIENVGASGVSAYYGDMNAFVLRRTTYMMLKRLVERYADYDQTGFLAFHRFDTVLEDVAAIAKLSHPAS